ncbi:MAG: hypothetical protein GOVbin4342_44 [Prokaryotic dsDNA virus sp.]|nr:MAG: hypothetical protein GOVbin4342_44 [Prokaryotic dsDNA virus sp.]|tara:strand:+ start:9506 stop:10729 length:1224 start_codon:yes stop_codon:yes gene_type:complete
MAITLISSPTLGVAQSANGEKDKMIFKFSSDDANIKSCIVEVLIDGVRVSALNVQPDLGTTDEFTVVLNEIVKNNLDFKLYTSVLSNYDTNDTGQKDYNIKVYEVVDNSGLLETNYDPDDANNSNYDYTRTTDAIAFNATFNAIQQNNFTVYDYQLDANDKKFLNDTPSVKNIELGQSEYLGVLWYDGTASQNFKVEILTYNSSDALLNTDYINITDWNTGYTGLNFDFYYITIPVGTSNLIAASVSLTNVAYYTIRIVNDGGDVSELKRFNIVDSCEQDVRIHWQNKYGKRDSYTFKGNKKESLKHSSSTFTKAKNETYSVDDRGVSVIQNISNSNFTAYSKTIGREEYHWLSDMLINKRAWVEIDGNYLPIIIEDGTFFKTDERNMPIQFVLEYSFANATKGLKG